MLIRFACASCGQRLKVESRKAGKTSTCPKCKASIVVPAAVKAETPEAAPAEPEPPPTDEAGAANDAPLFDFDQGIEVVYETPSISPVRSPRKRSDEDADLDHIGIPRYVIFLQGILLAVVGIVCFLLGMAVGGAVSERNGPVGNVPITVTGAVAIAAEGNRSPDGNSVVVFIPFDATPEEKGSLVGIRPGDDPAEGTKVRDYVQSLGGDVGKCDEHGQFSVQLPDRGRYFMLAISSNSKPSPNAPINPQHIAQLGKFFDLSKDPLDNFRYQWRIEGLRGSQRANVNFD